MNDAQIRYRRAQDRKQKGRIIDEVCNTLRCHRKHAIRLLNGKYLSLERPFRQREQRYDERLIEVLKSVWEASQYLWSERLKAALPLWLPWCRRRWKLSAQEEQQLLRMSPSTMDRRLAPYKKQLGRRIYGKTKPGKFLRQKIPIQTESWKVPEPGWTETDTVSHSGPSAHGMFAYTINETDLFSGWGESMSVLGKGSTGVVKALDEMRKAMPFEQKGLDSDNGEEFINWHLERYCQQTGLKHFRSRPYKKDDQAHIEQKNWTQVRKLIGWDRYDTQEAVAAMNDFYRGEHRLLINLFLPSVKLSKKIRVGSKIKRIYTQARTPLDCLLESGMGDRAKLEAYRKLRERLNPFELSQTIDKKLEVIWSLASKTKIKSAPRIYHKPMRCSEDVVLDGNAMGPLFQPFSNTELRKFRKQWYKDKLLQTS